MPALIYSKSHVRQLCEEYGLDARAVLDKFLAAVGAGAPKRKIWTMKIHAGGEDDSKVSYRLPPDEEIEGRTGTRNWPVLISGAALAGIALIVLVAVVVQDLRNRGEASPSPAAPSAEIDYEQFVVPQVLPVKQLPMPGE